MKFSIKKHKENINNWLKREGFTTPLKPRYILAFSTCMIIFAVIQILIAFLAINGLMEAKYVYGDEVEIPTSDIVLTAILTIISLVIIVISIIKMITTLRKVYKKRKSRNNTKQSKKNNKQ